MQTVKVSRKYQVAVPAAARRRLGIERGDDLLVDVRGEHLLLMRAPKAFAAKLAGLHAEVWSEVDARSYVRAEREAWAD